MEKEIIKVIMDENSDGSASLFYEVEEGFQKNLTDKEQDELFAAISREIEQTVFMKDVTEGTERVLEMNVRFKDDGSKDKLGRDTFNIMVQMRHLGSFDLDLLKERLPEDKFNEFLEGFDVLYESIQAEVQGYFETAYNYIK